MTALIGYLGILVGLVSALVLVVQAYRVARSSGSLPVATLRGPVLGLLGGAIVAFLALEFALVTHDFSIAYIARNNSLTTPLIFTLASGWAALEGSIALWGLVLAGFTFAVWRQVTQSDPLGAGALSVLGATAVFFFGLMATVADPFALCTQVANGVCSATSAIPIGNAVSPLDGVGANPLLQNHILMAVHPPLLYVGYVGLSVPFAFAISALALGEPGGVWLDRTHRWTVIAWSFLTMGIVLGGWWSYEVLGWGGYWAWDPVENAAFLPWLTATAFIHSAIVQRRRGMLQAWNFVLIIATFGLTILGTFLTRSGVILSVHSFSQSSVGPALLAFLFVSMVGALGLFGMRIQLVASSPRLDSLASREGSFLANNLLLTLFAFTVLLGTMYPLLVEAFGGGQVSVGRPFFDRASIPLAFALLLVMGIGPITPYRSASPAIVWSRIATPVVVALVAGAGAVLIGVRSWSVVVSVVLGAFVISVIVKHFVGQSAALVRNGDSWRSAIAKLFVREPGYWGGQISHIGVAILAIGIATSSALAMRSEVTIGTGETVSFAGYELTYVSPFLREESNRTVIGARIEVTRGGDDFAIMEPRVHQYFGQGQAVGTPDVRSGFTEDLYLSLARSPGDDVVIDAFRFPLIWMVWFGGSLIALGGGWSIVGVRRSRTRPARVSVDA